MKLLIGFLINYFDKKFLLLLNLVCTCRGTPCGTNRQGSGIACSACGLNRANFMAVVPGKRFVWGFFFSRIKILRA